VYATWREISLFNDEFLRQLLLAFPLKFLAAHMSVEEYSVNPSAPLDNPCPPSEGTSSHEENSPLAERNIIISSGLPSRNIKECSVSSGTDTNSHGRQLTPMPRILLPDSQFMGTNKSSLPVCDFSMAN
jgi:hypothetical protein